MDANCDCRFCQDILDRGDGDPVWKDIAMLADLLQYERTNLGLSLDEVGARTGFPSDTVRRAESGDEAVYQPVILYYLAELYGTDYVTYMKKAGHIGKRREPTGGDAAKQAT